MTNRENISALLSAHLKRGRNIEYNPPVLLLGIEYSNHFIITQPTCSQSQEEKNAEYKIVFHFLNSKNPRLFETWIFRNFYFVPITYSARTVMVARFSRESVLKVPYSL